MKGFNSLLPFMMMAAEFWNKNPWVKFKSNDNTKKVDISDFTRPKAVTGRNKPCPCGSGKKYKKCCIVISKHKYRKEEMEKSNG